MNHEKVAGEILEYVGGKDNVSFVTFCLTRLRLTLKDKSLLDEKKIESVQGVVGVRYVGAQFQIIIGQEVENVYKAFCKIGGFEMNRGVDEKIEEDIPVKEKLSFKGVLNNMIDTLAGCVAPILPVIMAAGLIKFIIVILGPSMLNLVSSDSDTMRLLSLVGDAGYYFFPVYVGYAAAKKFNCNIPLTLMLAGVLLHPSLIEIVKTGESFTVYGIPMPLVTYSSNFISMILIAWVMSYIERLLKKYIPGILKTCFVPVLLILIMLPLALCVLGPLGSMVGKGLVGVMETCYNIAGPFAIAIIGVLWQPLIILGMHQALIAMAVQNIGTIGFDAFILVGAVAGGFSKMGTAAAYALKAKGEDEKSYAITSFLTMFLGGISEPFLFGTALKEKKCFLYMAIGGFFGAFYAGLMHVKVYSAPVGNFLAPLCFAGEQAFSIVHGVIGCLISFVIAFVLAMIFGFGKKEKA